MHFSRGGSMCRNRSGSAQATRNGSRSFMRGTHTFMDVESALVQSKNRLHGAHLPAIAPRTEHSSALLYHPSTPMENSDYAATSALRNITVYVLQYGSGCLGKESSTAKILERISAPRTSTIPTTNIDSRGENLVSHL